MQSVSNRSKARTSYAARRVHIYKLRMFVFPLCIAALLLLAMSKMKLSFELSINGEVIGCTKLCESSDATLEAVKHDAEYALGTEWPVPELKRRLVFQEASPETMQLLKNKLYGMVDGAAWMELVYVDGAAICAFESQKEAAEVLRHIRELYINNATVSTNILERVSVGRGYSNKSLLENAAQKLMNALTVETEETKTFGRIIPFSVEIIERDDWYEDEWELVTKGEDGRSEMHYSITNQNGSVVDSSVLSNEVVKEPVTQVIYRGTKHHYSTGSFIWPVNDGWITSYFGARKVELGSNNHRGVDIAAALGTPIYAADGGEVIFSNWYYGYGQLVTIQHEDGTITRYAHNRKLLVEVGDMVEQGQQIAEMGTTGVSTGSHLHFEILPDGKKQTNPLKLLPAERPEGIREF